jgi:hypothetical protein
VVAAGARLATFGRFAAGGAVARIVQVAPCGEWEDVEEELAKDSTRVRCPFRLSLLRFHWKILGWHMAEDDAFDLVDRAFLVIADKEQRDGVSGLSPDEKVVYLIWTALGLIENGSFQYLFENNLTARTIADALAEVGLFESSRCFLLARDLLPADFETLDWPEQQAILERHEGKLDDLARQVVAGSFETEKRLANFIRSRPALLRLAAD